MGSLFDMLEPEPPPEKEAAPAPRPAPGVTKEENPRAWFEGLQEDVKRLLTTPAVLLKALEKEAASKFPREYGRVSDECPLASLLRAELGAYTSRGTFHCSRTHARIQFGCAPPVDVYPLPKWAVRFTEEMEDVRPRWPEDERVPAGEVLGVLRRVMKEVYGK